jgi:hypothetical protein
MDAAAFDLLVDRHLDGGLDVDGQERLESAIQRHPHLRQRFWELAGIHGHLAWTLQERHAELPGAEALATERALRDSSQAIQVHRPRPSGRAPKRSRGRGFWRGAVTTLVAAGIVVAGATVALTWRDTTPPPANADATLVDLAQAEWRDGVGPAVGEAVGNRLLALRSGLAQVRFANGATIIIAGPATFTARNSRGGELTSGRLVARVPESAKGFTIEADGVRVVDLGTEFALAAGDGADHHVQVYDGMVQVSATTAPVDLPQVLHQGEAVRVAPGGLIGSATYDERGFIRAMPAELASPALGRGLVAWWKLDEDQGTVVRDASGNGHDGVVRRATLDQLHVPGRSGGALRFIDRSYIEVANDPALQLMEMTLHAWVRPATDQRNDAQIICKQGSYGLAMPSNQAMKFYFWHMDRVIDRPFAPDRWVNLCATFDGAIRRFYVDGVRIASITSPTPPVTSDPLRIGALEGTLRDTERYFQGAIDELRIYNRALSDEEVRLLHLTAPAPR